MRRCRDCDSDLIPEEAAECGGWCMGCAPSCADCGATPAIHPITRRKKPFHVCAPCNRARGPILHPTVLAGTPFDWAEGAKAAGQVVDADGDMKIQWFARGGGIAKAGPFKSQIEATESMKLVDGGFPKDVFVWPERTKRKKTRGR